MPGDTIGGIQKRYVYIGGGVVIVVIGVVYFRTKQQQSQTTSGMVTDPAGNTCSALDPNSGYCPGTAEDLAYQQSTLSGANAASYVGGQIIGYDQYGNPIYSSGPSSPGPGSFTSNAQWAQAAETYLVQQEPNADPAAIAAALGQYINGKAATEAQISIINQAIAFEGIPPVGGPNGDPPGIITGGTGTTTGNVIVPNIVGMNWGKAHNTIVAAGLMDNLHINTSLIVVTQSPAAGTSVPAGSLVTATTSGSSGSGGSTSGKVTVPNIVGMNWGKAHNTIVAAGLTDHEHLNTNLIVVTQTPKASTSVAKGTVVTVTTKK